MHLHQHAIWSHARRGQIVSRLENLWATVLFAQNSFHKLKTIVSNRQPKSDLDPGLSNEKQR
jgi:hypothetical protein